MKRFHVHAHVDDLPASIAFYTRFFGVEPSRVEADYAKWMLDDPRINFAISTRGGRPGIDHLGIQADTDEELAEMTARARSADLALRDAGQTTCCYARSDKHWLTDPQGIAWECFRTLGAIAVFREKGTAAADAAACGAPPAPRVEPVGVAATPPSSCC